LLRILDGITKLTTLQELPPSQAMENGVIMPEIGHEKEPSQAFAARSASVDAGQSQEMRTCEMLLLHVTPYHSFVFLLEELSRPERCTQVGRGLTTKTIMS
jgi:hypothetical protein